MSVNIDIFNRHMKQNGGLPWYSVQRKGKKWQDADSGEIFEMFQIGTLAEAIGRSSKQVWLWDRKGQIPRPLFLPEGEKCKRWYSATQIVNCNRIYRYRYFGHKSLHRRLDEFLSDVRGIWYAQDIVVTEDGLINGR